MSTVIYPAFRLSKDANLFKVSEALRVKLTPILVEEFMRQVADYAVTNFDSGRDEDQSFRDYFMSMVNEIHNALIFDCVTMDDTFLLNTVKQIRDYLGIFLLNDVRDEVYLKLSSAYSEGFEDVVLSIDGIENEFSYYNSSDNQIRREVNPLTYEEWEDRKAAWNEVDSRNSNLAEIGICVNFFGDYSTSALLTKWETYEEAFDTLVTEKLKSRRFRHLVMNEYCSRVFKKLPELDLMDFMMSCFSALADNGGDVSMLHEAESHPEELKAAILYAEERVQQLPIA